MAARVLHARGQLKSAQEALIKYGQALVCWRSAKAHREAAETLRSVGEIYYETGQYQAARDSYQQAMSESKKVADVRGYAESLIALALVYTYLDQIDDSLSRSDEALVLSKKLNDEEIRAQVLSNYIFAHVSGGNLTSASRYADEAIALAEKFNDTEILGRALLFAGYVKNSDKLSEALDYYRRALLLFQKNGNLAWQSRALTAMGGVYAAMGELQQALNYNQQALGIQKQLGDRRTQGITFNNIGYAHRELGDIEHALENYSSALDCYRELRHQRGVAQTSVFVGNMYRLLGEFKKAREHYEVSQALSRKLGDKVLRALSLTNLGLLTQAEGDLAGAISCYSKALDYYNRIGDKRGQIVTHNALGYALDLHGQKDAALRHLSQALTLVQQTQDHELEILVRYSLAQLHQSLGQLDQAQSQMESSLQLIESLRVKLARFELRSSYFASVRQFYELSVDILMQMHHVRPNEGFDARAFELSEKARARSFLESLKESQVNVRADADARILGKEREIQRQLDEASVRRASLIASKANDADRNAIGKEIDRLTTEYQELGAQIRSNSTRYAALSPPQPLSLKEIQTLLDVNSVFLEYLLGDKRSYLWIVTSAEIHSFELPSRFQIESAVNDFHKILIANQPVQGETYEQRQSRITEADKELSSAAASLGKLVLGPVADRLGTKRVLIVADGALQSIPFQAISLPGSVESETGQPLLVKNEVVYEPSASALAMVLRDAPRRAGSRSVAVFANPVFDSDDPRVTAAKSAKTSSETKGVAHEVKQAFRDLGSGDDGRIPPLPASREEADAIISSVPWRSGFKAVGFEASRQTIARTDLSQYRIVHFATHSIVDYQHPELSGLVLSLVDEQGNPQDGFLRLHEIYNVKLPVDLVVLSACSTGLGKEVKGEGLIGLTRGFMYAGAGGVVASLWKVDDDATAEMMKHFYNGMFQKGLTPAAALREAQLTMRQQKRWESPYYWAAFVIQGQYDQKDLVRSRLSTSKIAALAAGILALSIAAAFFVRRRRRRIV